MKAIIYCIALLFPFSTDAMSWQQLDLVKPYLPWISAAAASVVISSVICRIVIAEQRKNIKNQEEQIKKQAINEYKQMCKENNVWITDHEGKVVKLQVGGSLLYDVPSKKATFYCDYMPEGSKLSIVESEKTTEEPLIEVERKEGVAQVSIDSSIFGALKKSYEFYVYHKKNYYFNQCSSIEAIIGMFAKAKFQ